jgi:4-amino-4-deoxy-L-arabinose transferase-like glycosyltransferase
VLSVLSVVGILVVCFVAMARSAGLARATMAPAIALTTMVLFWHVRKGGAGPLWALLLTCALLAGYQALTGSTRRSGAWWLACYAAAALAVLAVGFSAALLAAFVLGLYCFAARRRPVRSVAPHLLGLAVFAGVIALWLAAMCHAVPEHGITLKPLTQDLVGLWGSLREGGLPKAILATAAALLPWIVIVPNAFTAAVQKQREQGASFSLFTAIWLGALVVPAVLGGREGAPDYGIAIVPALAMLCAGVLVPDAPRFGSPSTAMRWPVRCALAIVGVFTGLVLLAGLLHLAGATYFIVGKRYVCPVTDQPYSPYALAGILPFVAASFAAVVAALRSPGGTPDRKAWLLILAVFLLGIPADLFLTPFVNAFRSARPFAEKVVQHVRPEDGLYLYRKDYSGLYNLYTGRAQIPVLENQKQLLECLSQPGVFVISQEKRIGQAGAPVILSDLSVARGRVGHRYMVLLRSVPAAGAEPYLVPGRQGSPRPYPDD